MNNKILKLSDECTGCFACYNACTKQAITMTEDDEGFLRPSIDFQKCTGCGLCDMVCPRITSKERYSMQIAYFGWSKSDVTRKESSSGGLFAELSHIVLSNDGVVYGASFDYSGLIRLECHSTDEVPLKELQKSKYVQSYIGDAYKRIRKDLQNDRMVMFCGTPCQAEGLRSFLRKDYDKLVIVDFICHGVPSMAHLRKHIEYLNLGKISKIEFRPKNRAWVDDIEYTFSKKKSASPIKYSILRNQWRMDEYFCTFENCKSIRPSCMICQHCNGQRSADITLADFWGIYKYMPELYDPKGISLVLGNTKHGTSFLQMLLSSERCEMHELPLKHAEYVYERVRSSVVSGYDKSQRDTFVHDLYTMDYKAANKKNGVYTPLYKKLYANLKMNIYKLINRK